MLMYTRGIGHSIYQDDYCSMQILVKSNEMSVYHNVRPLKNIRPLLQTPARYPAGPIPLALDRGRRTCKTQVEFRKATFKQLCCYAMRLKTKGLEPTPAV